MIHIIPHTRSSLYADQFLERDELLRRLRERRASDAAQTGRSDGPENVSLSSEADTPLAVHLMKLTEAGALLGAVKLNPSELRPPQSAHGQMQALQTLPAQIGSWDASDFCFRTGPHMKRTFADIMLGMLEFALTWEIKSLNFLIDEDLLPVLNLLPIAVQVMGAAVEVQGTSCAPATLRITPEALRGMRALMKAKSPILHLAADQTPPSPLGQ